MKTIQITPCDSTISEIIKRHGEDLLPINHFISQTRDVKSTSEAQ